MKAVVYTNPKDGVQRPGTKLKIISVNLFRFQQLENYQRRSPFRLESGTRSRSIV